MSASTNFTTMGDFIPAARLAYSPQKQIEGSVASCLKLVLKQSPVHTCSRLAHLTLALLCCLLDFLFVREVCVEDETDQPFSELVTLIFSRNSYRSNYVRAN